MKSILEFVNQKPIRKRSEVYIIKDNTILFGIPSKEYSTYIIPGGKIENDETPEQAAVREAKEEVGIIVKDLKYLNKTIIKYSGTSANPYIQKNIDRYSGVEIHTFIGYFKDVVKVNTNQDDVYKTIALTKQEAIVEFTKALKIEKEDFNKHKLKYVLECLRKI